MNQNVQDKLRQEIMDMDNKLNGKLPNFSQIRQCNYLDAVIKEGQRLYPVAPFLVREAVRDTEINGVLIPSKVYKLFFLLKLFFLNFIFRHHWLLIFMQFMLMRNTIPILISLILKDGWRVRIILFLVLDTEKEVVLVKN